MSTSCFIDHHPGAEPGDSGARSKAIKSLKWALFTSIGLILIEVAGGYVSGSLALLADAVHVFADSAALAFTLFASWLAEKPHSPERSYGYYRIEILAALLNGVILIVLTAFVLKSAYFRLQNPASIESTSMLWVSLLGFAVNVFMLVLLHRHHDHNLNIRAAYLHILGDTLSSVAVVSAAILIKFSGWLWADPVASIIVALIILSMAIRLLWDSSHILLEGTPRHLDAKEVEGFLKQNFPQIMSIHDFHIWEITAHMVALTAHIEVRSQSMAENKILIEQMNLAIRSKYRIGHTTFQIDLAS